MDKRLCASFASFDTISSDTFQYERTLIRSGYPLVAGVDEAGRGPLAGPVVAGCVILPQSCEFSRFKDSKVLTAAKRESTPAKTANFSAALASLVAGDNGAIFPQAACKEAFRLTEFGFLHIR